ncbi:MAG: 4-(cytidine 5'-diphospho)-2-C-methyl-D-erythritol kinase [Bacteroidota bacterium]
MLSRPAPAKVNLGLYVLRRRPDGYHEIETVFVPISWHDELTAEPHDTLVLTTSDPALPTDRGNLVWRAAEALAEWAGIEPRARLHLDKRVPYGAGLGSGSSDAAVALQLCAELWHLDVPEADLHRLGERLGADVPFFLGEGAMLGTGLGSDLVPLARAEGSLWRCPFALVVAVPPVHVNTAEAYRLIAPSSADRADLAAAVTSDDLERWRREVTNDFEAPVATRHPGVREMLRTLRQSGAGWAALSGSGSSVVGAFERVAEAEAAADAAREAGARVWVEPPRATG